MSDLRQRPTLPSQDFQYMQGARQQGIKEHVKVKKKHDSTGVGAVSPTSSVYILWQMMAAVFASA